jgi:hypothetical protein
MSAAPVEISAYGARWSDSQGQIVGVTHAGSMCWRPRLPRRLRIASVDFEHVVPCRDCPGCLEFYRRRQQIRLTKLYPKKRETLYLLTIEAKLSTQVAMVRRARSWKGAAVERGFWRLGTGSVGVLVRSRAIVAARLRRLGFHFRFRPLYLSRGRRAFAPITRGLLVERSVYGENLNRFYVPGLPPAEKNSWEVVKLAKQPKYDNDESPRAWTADRRKLLPPRVRKLLPLTPADARRLLERVGRPERVLEVGRFIQEQVARAFRRSNVVADPKAPEEIERQRAFVMRTAVRDEGDKPNTPRSENNPSPSLGGGYTTSVESTIARAPPKDWLEVAGDVAATPRPAWMVREDEDEEARRRSQARQQDRFAQRTREALERLRARVMADERGAKEESKK